MSAPLEDGGNEDHAIAGRLHDTIEDGGQTHASIQQRFGVTAADIMRDCTDPGKVPGHGVTDPWTLRKQSFIETLARLSEASLLVTAAEKAHNSRDKLLDAGSDPEGWNRFFPGFDGLLWYFWSLHNQFLKRLPGSCSVQQLGDTVHAILACPKLVSRLPAGLDREEWVATYLQRSNIHADIRISDACQLLCFQPTRWMRTYQRLEITTGAVLP